MPTQELTKNEVGTALTLRPGEGGQLSGLDKQLLAMAAKRYTPEQMAEELAGAITPARAAQRVREIYQSQDWFDVAMQQQQVVNDMVEVRNHLFEIIKAEGGYVEGRDGRTYWSHGDPRWSANLIRLLKDFRELTQSLKVDADAAANQIKESHAMLMLKGIEAIFQEFTSKLVSEYGIPEEELRELLEACLPRGFRPIEEKIVADA